MIQSTVNLQSQKKKGVASLSHLHMDSDMRMRDIDDRMDTEVHQLNRALRSYNASRSSPAGTFVLEGQY